MRLLYQGNKVSPDAISNVIPILTPTPQAAPRATEAEIAEYRKNWPKVLVMLREWDAIKGSGGCPVARQITDPPPDD